MTASTIARGDVRSIAPRSTQVRSVGGGACPSARTFRGPRVSGGTRLTVVRSDASPQEEPASATTTELLPLSWRGIAEEVPVSAAVTQAPVGHRVRLTRRGRIVVLSLLVAVACVIFALGRASAGATVMAGNHRVTVQSGDTLWSIAATIAPHADPRVEVAALEQVNHLQPGAALEPGQLLTVPVLG